MQHHVEMHYIGLTVCSDGEVHEPPTPHLKFQTVNQIITIPKIFGNARLGGQSMTMLRHVSINVYVRVFHRSAISRLNMESPLVYLVDKDSSR
jgi:hypothetical protein